MRGLILQIRKIRMSAMHLGMATRVPGTDTCLPHFVEAKSLDRLTFSPSLALKGETFLTPYNANAILVCFVLWHCWALGSDPTGAPTRERSTFLSSLMFPSGKAHKPLGVGLIMPVGGRCKDTGSHCCHH